MGIPGDDHGRAEDIVNTLFMLGGNWPLVCIVVTRAVFAAAYNVFDVLMIESLNSVHTMLVQQWCTALVWASSLGVYYLWDTKSAVAEAWTPYSFRQLVGFVV